MRRGLVAVTTGLLLCLPTAALAQDAPSEAPTAEPTAEVGVGEAAAVERDPAQSAETPDDQTGIGEADRRSSAAGR